MFLWGSTNHCHALLNTTAAFHDATRVVQTSLSGGRKLPTLKQLFQVNLVIYFFRMFGRVRMCPHLCVCIT